MFVITDGISNVILPELVYDNLYSALDSMQQTFELERDLPSAHRNILLDNYEAYIKLLEEIDSLADHELAP